MDSTAKLEKLGALLAAGIIMLTPVAFSGSFSSSFSFPEASLFRIGTTFLLLITASYFWKTKQYPDFRKFLFSPVGFLLILFFAVQFLATVFSIAPLVSIFGNYDRQQGFLTQFHYLLFVGLLLCISQFPAIKQRFVSGGLFAVSFAGVLPAIYGILQKLGFDPFFGDWATGEFFGRVFSTVGQPNLLGQLFLLTIPASVALYFNGLKTRVKIYALAAIFLQIITLILTLSRSSMLGLWLFFFLLIIGYSWLNKKKIWVAAAVLIFIVLPLFLLAVAPGLSNTDGGPGQLASRFVLTGESLRSIKTRSLLWPMAFEMFQQHPLLGQGPETFHLTFPKYQKPQLLTEEFYTGFADRAHNAFLDMLVTTGLLGLMSYLAFLFVLFLSVKKTTTSVVLTSGLLGFLLANMFGFEIIPHSILFWTTVAVIISLLPASLPNLAQRKGETGFRVTIIFIILFAFINIFAWNIKPLVADYHHQKGLEANMPFPERAKEHFAKAAQIFPLEPTYLLAHGEAILAALRSTGDTKEKTELGLKLNQILAKLFRFTKENFEVYGLYGNSMETLAEGVDETSRDQAYKIAEWAFRKANELSPNSPLSLFELANFYFRRANFQEAVNAYERLLAISPPYWKWTPEELLQKSKYEQDRYRTFFINHSNFWDIFSSLRDAYQQLGKVEKAAYYGKYAR